MFFIYYQVFIKCNSTVKVYTVCNSIKIYILSHVYVLKNCLRLRVVSTNQLISILFSLFHTLVNKDSFIQSFIRSFIHFRCNFLLFLSTYKIYTCIRVKMLKVKFFMIFSYFWKMPFMLGGILKSSEFFQMVKFK